MTSNEERVILQLQMLGGKASNEDLLRLLDWSGPGARQRLGHILARLRNRGLVERRRVEHRSLETIYELNPTLLARRVRETCAQNARPSEGYLPTYDRTLTTGAPCDKRGEGCLTYVGSVILLICGSTKAKLTSHLALSGKRTLSDISPLGPDVVRGVHSSGSGALT
jgi:hypothetical protein